MRDSNSIPKSLEWTGERYLPEIEGTIKWEHLHRYALAAKLVQGKRVIDIACGEGYGSNMLALVANSVTGLDISKEAVNHARLKYQRPNLEFLVGTATEIPLGANSIDVVVSFETIEHLDQHEKMMSEIKRVLKPEGLLIISSPNKYYYSIIPNYSNPFHVKELFVEEFDRLLKKYFGNIQLLGQRVVYGSLAIPQDVSNLSFKSYTNENEQPGLSKPVYDVAIASDLGLPEVAGSLFEIPIDGEDATTFLANLNQAIAERDGQIASLNQAIAMHERENIDLEASRADLHLQLVTMADEHQRVVDWAKELNEAIANSSIKGRGAALLKRLRGIGETAKTSWRAFQGAVSFYGSFPFALRRGFAVLCRDGLPGIKRRVEIFASKASQPNRSSQQYVSEDLYGTVPSANISFAPKVSVIVPNFNHARYLRERLESVYMQTYDNFEVILLDDCSTDNSVSILQEFAERYPEKTVCSFNNTNSGGVFNQWKKGLALSTGELIWIAESDDYCSENLLEELVRFFQNSAVMLAFARVEFVKGSPPEKVWTLEEYLSDLSLEIWGRPFIKSAHNMVKFGWSVKNIVPNVSSAIFRHPLKMDLLDDPQWLNLRMCGDWLFYLTRIRGGLVAYSPLATNYYRQHPMNTSVNTQKEFLYYKEFEVVANHLAKLYKLDRIDFEKQEKNLLQHWCNVRGSSQVGEFNRHYGIEKACQLRRDRKPNIFMAVYALSAGGGETFPIMLANLLHDRGYAVTLFNCKEQKTESGVRGLLSKDVPLLELDRLDLFEAVCVDMGIELVHSHHAWVDVTLSTLLLNSLNIKQIVSMHGMYEMMTTEQVQTILPILKRRIDRFVYTAEKNLTPFSSSLIKQKGFCKIDNALAVTDISPVSRSELQLGADDFVLCMVARAIPDKGWEEAINAVVWANARSRRNIHLLMIGEGPEFERLKLHEVHDVVHFLGFRPNIRDYFAASDIGFLPSRFKGESFPLVLIDCLYAGKPVLASDIGEIRNMLDTEEGLAGALFDLQDWAISIETVGQTILKLANDAESYQDLLRCVPIAAAKFDPLKMVEKYEDLYRSCMAGKQKASIAS